VNSNFTVSINKTEISRSESVKYLGLRTDEKLNWSAHTQQLSSQLARCCKMLFQARDYVADYTLTNAVL